MEFRPSTLIVLLAGLLGAGCSRETEPLETAGPLPSANISRTQPPRPPFRTLDAAADEELRQAFDGDRERQETALRKYATQRWRFRGTVGFKDDRHAVVHPEGLEPVFVYFRSSDSAADVQLGEVHLFEAALDDWVSRYLQDAVVIPADPR